METKYADQPTYKIDEKSGGVIAYYESIQGIVGQGIDESEARANLEFQRSYLINVFEKKDKINSELIEISEKLIEAMNQYSFFSEGYKNGSASISEVSYAGDDVEKYQSKLFVLIKKIKNL